MDQSDEVGRTTVAKVRRRLIPFLFLLYVVAYLDRVNLSFAALDMNRDLGFTAAVYGLGSGIFFISYTVLEVPSNLMLARFGPRLWIARIMLTWGLVSASMAFVHDARTFYLLRFVLGAAEAGFFPGIIYYLTLWFPTRDRGRAVALFMTGTAVAGVIGGPISSALLLLDGVAGLRGWQWLFVVEGIPAVLLAPVVWRRLAERPVDADWLSVAEREWLSAALARDAEAAPHAHHELSAAFRSGRVWALTGIYFCLVLAIYGVGFWLPQIVRSLGAYPSAGVALISAVPYVAAALGMVAVGARSDRTGERRWHVALSSVAGAVGFGAAALGPASTTTALAALSLAALGVWGALGPFWALLTAILRGRAAAGGVALVNSVGNIAGFVGPSIIGYVHDRTGGFAGGLWLLSAGMAAGAAIAVALPADPLPAPTGPR